jgi:alkane 1-monooxygenase
MDRRVAAHFGGDIRLANLHPAKREQLLRRWRPMADAGRVAGRFAGRVAGASGPGSGRRGANTSERIETDDGVRAARCPGCGYTYEVDAGNELEGFAAGTAWKDIPDDWCCPDCGVREKVDFVPLTNTSA